jgi:hypothetical protein
MAFRKDAFVTFVVSVVSAGGVTCDWLLHIYVRRNDAVSSFIAFRSIARARDRAPLRVPQRRRVTPP